MSLSKSISEFPKLLTFIFFDFEFDYALIRVEAKSFSYSQLKVT